PPRILAQSCAAGYPAQFGFFLGRRPRLSPNLSPLDLSDAVSSSQSSLWYAISFSSSSLKPESDKSLRPLLLAEIGGGATAGAPTNAATAGPGRMDTTCGHQLGKADSVWNAGVPKDRNSADF